MSVEAVKKFFRAHGLEGAVMELDVSCATVEEAARALGVDGARIAKTLSFAAPPGAGEKACILVVAAGDARIDGGSFKRTFGIKSKMLSPEQALKLTGHAVGGVCPFAVSNPAAAIYLDQSLRRFETIFPACGGPQAMTEISQADLFTLSGARGWVNVCRDWETKS